MKNALVRRSPFLTPTTFIDTDSIFSQMESALETAFGDLWQDSNSTLNLLESSAYPRVDIKDEETQYTVIAEIPGLTKEDVKVEVVNNALVIRGEKRKEVEEKKGTYLRRELKRSSFSRQVCSLNVNCDVDKIDATFKDGLLTITIPKKVSEPIKQEVKQITVK